MGRRCNALSLPEEVSKNRSIRVPSCIVPRNAVQSSPATQGGFTNWCRASITASASLSILPPRILPSSVSAIRYASRANNAEIIFHRINLVEFASHLSVCVHLFTISKIIRDCLIFIDEILRVDLMQCTHNSRIYTIDFIISPLRVGSRVEN